MKICRNAIENPLLRTTTGRFVLVPFIIAMLAGCSQGKEEVVTAGCKATGDKFFGLCEFINNRIAEYTDAGYTVDKTVSLNDKSESIESKEVNWKMELQPLASSYINRSAWLNKFDIDTTLTDDGYSVRYTSHRADIPIKELEVLFSGGVQDAAVTLIRVKSARKNLLYTSNQEIEFAPESYYSVKGKQRTLFLSKTEFSVYSEIVTGS